MLLMAIYPTMLRVAHSGALATLFLLPGGCAPQVANPEPAPQPASLTTVGENSIDVIKY